MKQPPINEPDDPADDPEPGMYLHWKGGVYQVLCCAADHNHPGRRVVVYTPLREGITLDTMEVHVRSVSEFNDTIHLEDGSVCMKELCSRIVGQKFAPRFKLILPSPI